MIDIESLTIAEARKLAAFLATFIQPAPSAAAAPAAYPIPLGSYVAIQTVLPLYLGTLEEVTPQCFVLRDAVWVADTGRHSEFAASSEAAKEVEPYPKGLLVVERSSVLSVRIQPGKHLSEVK
jgi:hypothetical protein